MHKCVLKCSAHDRKDYTPAKAFEKDGGLLMGKSLERLVVGCEYLVTGLQAAASCWTLREDCFHLQFINTIANSFLL